MTDKASFYWHDYETFGTDPKRDWPSQFAGIRTDMNLEIIGKPLMIFCKPNADCLPHPEACLLTGISPLKALKEGLPEKDFIARIHQEMSQTNTCSAGYNSIRFDDEVTRNALYRNFYDPYQREYANGNSRWDIIDLVRMTYALRPEGIEWPLNEEGAASFRLELLTEVNGIKHEAAHDALSDVIATIEIAKLIRQKQPKLFEYYRDFRKKNKAFEILHKSYQEPVVHVSSKFPARQSCLAIVMGICPEPGNNNGIVVTDLSKSPEQFLDLSAEELKTNLFSKTEDLPEGCERPPIKTVHANKSPALAPLNTLRDEDKERLALDFKEIEKNQSFIHKFHKELVEKIKGIYQDRRFEKTNDPDLMIYGGFFSNRDKSQMQRLIGMKAEGLSEAQHNLNFEDERIASMLFRYRARNFPESLSLDEQKEWKQFCEQKIRGELESSSISLEAYHQKISEFKEQFSGNPDKLAILEDLEIYASDLLNQINC